MNTLLTGRPRVGKTTALESTLDRLEGQGFTVGGVTAPALLEDGDRVGFRLIDCLGGEAVTMAHIDYSDGPTVGKYTVDVEATDDLAGRAFEHALAAADVIAIDEIAPMEIHSDAFVEGVNRALDSPLPVLGVVHRSSGGFIGAVKDRDDVEVITVTTDNRDGLPDRLLDAVVGATDGPSR